MLFSFSSSSFHSSFPRLPPTSLLFTCETYAMWLIWQLCCVHCPVNVHICFCHSSSLCIPSPRLMSLMMINLIFFSVFAQFVLAASLLQHPTPPPTPTTSAYLRRSGHPHFICASLLPCAPIIIVIALFIAPPLTRLNSSSLLPFPSVLQSTCDTLRSHSDSLGFTPNMLPRHPTLGNFEEFACWQH